MSATFCCGEVLAQAYLEMFNFNQRETNGGQIFVLFLDFAD